jgi:hypothetical protein
MEYAGAGTSGGGASADNNRKACSRGARRAAKLVSTGAIAFNPRDKFEVTTDRRRTTR